MKLNRTIICYIILAAIAFIFARIYESFGHGVASHWMSDAYLCLLGLGAAIFALLRMFSPDITSRKGYRLFYNTYNSGIAILITGMLQKGILDIAGGTSQLVPWFFYASYAFISAAFVIFMMVVGRSYRFRQ